MRTCFAKKHLDIECFRVVGAKMEMRHAFLSGKGISGASLYAM